MHFGTTGARAHSETYLVLLLGVTLCHLDRVQLKAQKLFDGCTLKYCHHSYRVAAAVGLTCIYAWLCQIPA